MGKIIRIGTRESQLAVWQARLVQQLLLHHDIPSELVYIKSEGDIDLKTPLYQMGVQGIFTKTLDIALLNGTIDIAVHSMKDVPVQLAQGIVQGAVLERASYKDLLVYKTNKLANDEWLKINEDPEKLTTLLNIATSSIRRKAQWLNRFPDHTIENLRGNVNTRLKKLEENYWDGAVFAAAGLERIDLRPKNSIELNWMLPAPAQGAILVVCRETDIVSFNSLVKLNHAATDICTKIERDFLSLVLGGCSTPVSALAEIKAHTIIFKGNLLSVDGKDKMEIEKIVPVTEANDLGKIAAAELLKNGGQKISDNIRNAAK